MKRSWIYLVLVLLLAGCGSGLHNLDDIASVSVLPSEDLAGPCTFELVLAKAAAVQRGVIVIYERGDSELVFHDGGLRDLATQLTFSIVFARQCDGITNGDFQSKPAKGPGRVLFQALTQFAGDTAHPELATAGVILYGFSAAGVLATEMASFAPDRVMGVVGYASGSAQQNVAKFTPAAAALAIPSLFLANAADEQSGTTRSMQYFMKGQARGATWSFGVQRGEGHCCTLTTLPVVLPWIASVASRPTVSAAAGGVSGSFPGSGAWFICSPNGVRDAQRDQNCTVSSAGVGAAGVGATAVWLPDATTSQQWLTWVTNTSQN